MKKYTQKEVEETFKSKGYILANGEKYTGIYKHLTVYSKEGYKLLTTFGQLINSNKEPSPFSTHNPHTIENIKHWLKLNDLDFILLSEKYEGKGKDLLWNELDSNQEPFYSSWDNFD